MWVIHHLAPHTCPHLHTAAQTCTWSSSKPGANPKILKTVDPSLLISLLAKAYKKDDHVINLCATCCGAVLGRGSLTERLWKDFPPICPSSTPGVSCSARAEFQLGTAQCGIVCHHSKRVINIIIEET